MKLTIPAREIQPGDLIEMVCEVSLNDQTGANQQVCFIALGSNGSVTLRGEHPVAVERADPDAALIERMAEAMTDGNSMHPDYWRKAARKALAAMRADS